MDRDPVSASLANAANARGGGGIGLGTYVLLLGAAGAGLVVFNKWDGYTRRKGKERPDPKVKMGLWAATGVFAFGLGSALYRKVTAAASAFESTA